MAQTGPAGDAAPAGPSTEALVAQAVHDLRQPLLGLTGHLALLAKAGPLPPEQQERLADARAAAARLQTALDHLLAYLGSGRRIALTEVDLQQVIDRLRSELAPALAASGGRIEAEGLPRLRGDAVLVARLFGNLLANALHYHRPGVPPIVRISARQDGKAWRVDVVDNGVGMDAAQLAQAGTPFRRFHPDLAEGTGLGLASCHRIAAAHGWRLWADSAPGRGTTFHIEVPDERIVRGPPTEDH